MIPTSEVIMPLTEAERSKRKREKLDQQGGKIVRVKVKKENHKETLVKIKNYVESIGEAP
jgi:4-hydroxy-3-methylbut-2-en-1-yl diphosphate synthase IspG/GcpE